MKNLKNTLKALTLLVVVLSFGLVTMAQERQNIVPNSIVIYGTSNLHDWTMKSGSASGNMVVTLNAQGKVAAISGLTFNVPSKSLKSEKGSIMDKNAYNAMNADANPNITFTAPTATVTTTDGVNYVIKAPGVLLLGGARKNLEIVATGRLNADKSMTITGSKAIDMTQWGVKPPTFMFGAMKTGKDITLKFTVTSKK